ncbi:MAG: uracil-DNA glycosylase family protein [Ignavibacteriaceae bacterium]
MKTSEVFVESLKIRDILKIKNDFSANPIDISLSPIPPFCISDNIKIIIIGQDPTVKIKASRERIKCTLNLDKNGSLKNYILNICKQLGLGIENIYATNIFKYFYDTPPARTPQVLNEHLVPNLELLKSELACYPQQLIITLGLPVLQLLVDDKAQVRDYWGYDKKTGKKLREFSYCKASNNKLNRDIFPFPHQPSVSRIKYYSSNLEDYISYMKLTY